MSLFFFFNDTATTEIYTLSLHDALPIWTGRPRTPAPAGGRRRRRGRAPGSCVVSQSAPLHGRNPLVRAIPDRPSRVRSEEHTSELQSRQYLVCRLLLEKKKNQHLLGYLS